MGIYRLPIQNGQHALPHGRSVDTGRALICFQRKKNQPVSRTGSFSISIYRSLPSARLRSAYCG